MHCSAFVNVDAKFDGILLTISKVSAKNLGLFFVYTVYIRSLAGTLFEKRFIGGLLSDIEQNARYVRITRSQAQLAEAMFRLAEIIVLLVLASLWQVNYYYQ